MMVDPQENDASNDSDRNVTEPPSGTEPPSSKEPEASATPTPQPSPLMSSELEREVATAMGSMDAAEMAELCGESSASDSVEPGTALTGRIVGLSDEEVFVEFGPKLQGTLPRAQLKEGEKVEVGAMISAIVDHRDKESDMLVLRRKGVVQKAKWDTLRKGMIVAGRVTGLIKGGLEVDLNGIRGFMPGSQASASPMRDISVLLNEQVRCEVIEVDKRGKNVVLSRRKLIEREQADAAKKLKAELAVGQIRAGVVRNITDFGAFVDIGGLEGLVHIRDMSWGNVDKVTDVLSIDQKVDVQVLKIDLKRGRISLGLKQMQPDPWTHAAERYPVGTALKVRIVRIVDFGAFAELEPGIEGLIPIREMSWSRIKMVSDAVNPGDMVDSVVIGAEFDRRRISLSIKQSQSDPWDGVLDDFEPNSLTKGRVTRLVDFGAFVELFPGVEGLIHISEMSDQRVRSSADVLKVDQEIEARVLGVDKDERRISLSLKQVKEPLAAATGSAPEAPQPPKKRKKPLRGGLSSHFDW